MGIDKKIKFETYLRNVFKQINDINELDKQAEMLFNKFNKSEMAQSIITDLFLQRKEKILNNKDKNHKWLTENTLRKKHKAELDLINNIADCNMLVNAQYKERPYKKKTKK